MSVEKEILVSHAALQKKVIENHAHYAKAWKYFKANFLNESSRPSIDGHDNVVFSNMACFVHAHYLELDVTPEVLGENIKSLVMCEEEHDIDIAQIFLESAPKIKTLINEFPSLLSKKDCFELNKNQLEETFENFINYVCDKNVYGPLHALISEHMDTFVDNIIPLTAVMDHTKVGYGSSGLKFRHTGLDNPILVESDQPLLGCTVIYGANGKNKWDLGFVFKNFSTNEEQNKLKTLMLLNSTDIPISNKTLIFTQQTGSADGEIQTQFNHFNFQQMPEGPKRFIDDYAKANQHWMVAVNMAENRVDHNLVPPHMTKIFAAPDDAIFNRAKNGCTTDVGIKRKFERAFNSTANPPFGPTIKNNIVKPLDEKLVIDVIQKTFENLPSSICLESMHRVGNHLCVNMHNAKTLKSFLKRVILTKVDFLKERSSRPNRSTIRALKNLYDNNFFVNASSKLFPCLLDQCDRVFQKKEEQTKHTLYECPHLIRFCQTTEELLQKVAEYKANSAENIPRGRILLIEAKAKKYSCEFKCPAVGCTFSRSRWRSSPKSVAGHIIPGNSRSCTFLIPSQIHTLCETHPVFSDARAVI